MMWRVLTVSFKTAYHAICIAGAAIVIISLVPFLLLVTPICIWEIIQERGG